MVDTPTARFGARKQSLGSNVNTWGDTKLNEVLDLLDRGTKGYQAVAMTGDTTLAWTNYAAANPGQVQTIKLTGALSAAASLVVPSREWAFTVVNAAGHTVTVKTSAGAGVAIPAGYQAALYCDGIDVRNAAPTVLGGAVQIAGALQVNGRIGNVTSAAADTDAVTKAQMDAAIAAATTSSSPGTVRVTSTDTAAKFLNAAISVSGALTKTLTNPGANEGLELGVTPYIVDGGVKTTHFSAAPGYRYTADCRGGTAITATLDAAWSSATQLGQIVKLGSGILTLSPGAAKLNGLAVNLLIQEPGLLDLRYVDAAFGVVTSQALTAQPPSPAAGPALDFYNLGSWSY
jgi:hypothetical protein